VYGMPAAAHQLGAVQRLVPIDRMAHAIVRAVRGGDPR
jgi:chemotaxis response regulator CheB